MAYLIILVVIAIAISVISAPLRAARSTREADARANREAELEAARDAKYREIRDAELDRATGKLSDEDYAEIDGALRREAIEIMHELDAARAQPVAPTTA
ncbi:MAG TPA: hypothetical protein VFN55_06425 [Solirubrobacteraceae bacterium]|nr:hypothetical protein [Solirubrobacteraceae bacterium]